MEAQAEHLWARDSFLVEEIERVLEDAKHISRGAGIDIIGCIVIGMKVFGYHNDGFILDFYCVGEVIVNAIATPYKTFIGNEFERVWCRPHPRGEVP